MMTFGPKRGHILYIFDEFFKDFSLLIIAIIVGLIKGDLWGAVTSNAGVAIVILLLPAVRIIEYLTTRITVTPEKITVKKGLVNIVESEIPAASVTTIDYSQNVIQQLFKVYRIKIENSSNMSVDNAGNKIKMVFRMDDIDEIRNILGKAEKTVDGANIAPESDEMSGRNRKIRIPAGKIVQMGLLKSKGKLLIEGFVLLSVVIGYMSESALEDIESRIMALSIAGGIMAAAILIVLILAIEVIVSVIRFSNFTLTDMGETIKIEYGLLTKKQYSLVKSRMSGFSYEQSFFMRKMKLGTLSVFAVGFGNDGEQNSSSMIHPLIAEHRVREFIGEFTDHFSEPCEMKRAAECSLRYFFYRPVFIMTILILTAGILLSIFLEVFWPVIVALLLFVPAFAGRVMEYGNTMAGGNEKEIVLVSGGFKRVWTYIRTDNAESVKSSGSIWKRRRDIANIEVDFLGLAEITTSTVYNMDIEMEERLKSLLVY